MATMRAPLPPWVDLVVVAQVILVRVQADLGRGMRADNAPTYGLEAAAARAAQVVMRHTGSEVARAASVSNAL